MNPSDPLSPSDHQTAANVPAAPAPEPIHKPIPIHEQPPANQYRVEHGGFYDDQLQTPPKTIIAIPREPAVPILVESPAPEPITKSAHVPKMRHYRKFPVDRNQGYEKPAQQPMGNSSWHSALLKVILILLFLIVLLPIAGMIFLFVICSISGGGSKNGHW